MLVTYIGAGGYSSAQGTVHGFRLLLNDTTAVDVFQPGSLLDMFLERWHPP